MQVLTPIGVLDRDKQLGVVRELTEVGAAAVGDASLSGPSMCVDHRVTRGWLGINGHADTGADIAQAGAAPRSSTDS